MLAPRSSGAALPGGWTRLAHRGGSRSKGSRANPLPNPAPPACAAVNNRALIRVHYSSLGGCRPVGCALPGARAVPAQPAERREGVPRARHGGRAAGVRAGPGADRLRSLPPPSAAEMRGAKKRQALPAIVLLLLASAPPPPGAEGRDVPAAGAERGALLDILLQALGDDGRPLPPRPARRERVISRRFSGGSAPPAEPRAAAAAAPPPPRLFAAARHGGKRRRAAPSGEPGLQPLRVPSVPPPAAAEPDGSSAARPAAGGSGRAGSGSGDALPSPRGCHGGGSALAGLQHSPAPLSGWSSGVSETEAGRGSLGLRHLRPAGQLWPSLMHSPAEQAFQLP